MCQFRGPSPRLRMNVGEEERIERLEPAEVREREPMVIFRKPVSREETILTTDQRQRVTNVAPPDRFADQNPSPEDFQAMTIEERSKWWRAIEERNQAWIENALSVLGLVWIKVVDGVVEAGSRHIGIRPSAKELFQEAQERGKLPFVFVAKGL